MRVMRELDGRRQSNRARKPRVGAALAVGDHESAGDAQALGDAHQQVVG